MASNNFKWQVCFWQGVMTFKIYFESTGAQDRLKRNPYSNCSFGLVCEIQLIVIGKTFENVLEIFGITWHIQSNSNSSNQMVAQFLLHLLQS